MLQDYCVPMDDETTNFVLSKSLETSLNMLKGLC